MVKVSFSYRGKKIQIDAKKANFLEVGFGLMFKRKGKAEAILFQFRKPTKMRIHSYFVFFPFVAVWLDKDSRVIDIRKVEPFTFSVSTKKPYSKLVEIPLNKRYARKVNFSSRIRKV